MIRTMKKAFIILITFFTITVSAQNVAINESGTAADSSAMLDVASTSKGMLIPRMTTAQREMIEFPAIGLLVFDNVTETFWFHDQDGWVELISGNADKLSDDDGDTRVEVEQSADDDTIRFITKDIERARIGLSTFELLNNGESVFIGEEAGVNHIGAKNHNVAVGYQSLFNTDLGSDNVAIGHSSMFTNETGENNVGIGYRAFGSPENQGRYHHNVGIGHQALYTLLSGDGNVAIGKSALFMSRAAYGNVAVGWNAMEGNVSGSENVAMGRDALAANSAGDANVAIGDSSLSSYSGDNITAVGTKAGLRNVDGVSNVYIGNEAGRDNLSSTNTFVGYEAGKLDTAGFGNTFIGSRAGGNSRGFNNTFLGRSSGYSNDGDYNVFIGPFSGFNASGDHKLFIDNSSTSNPLIYGDFSLNRVAIHGQMGIGAQNGLGVQLLVDAPANTAPFRARVDGLTQFIVDNDGEVGIGTLSPTTPLQIEGGTDASLSDGSGFLTIGNHNASNIVIDGNEIMARDNASTSDLFLQANGGFVGINRSTASHNLDLNGTMRVRNGGATRMIVADDGQVGIGDATPDSRLVVNGSIGETPLRVRQNGTSKLFVHSNGRVGAGESAFVPEATFHVQHNNGNVETNGFSIGNGTDVRWHFHPNTQQNLVLYGDNGPNFAHHGTFLWALGDYIPASDRRLKKNIEDIGPVLEKVRQLQPRKYNMLVEKESARRSFGFIAQEVEPLFPENVRYDGDTDTYSLLYKGFSILAIKAIQELADVIEQQGATILQMQQQIDQLKR
jgi:hypothetical protein